MLVPQRYPREHLVGGAAEFDIGGVDGPLQSIRVSCIERKPLRKLQIFESFSDIFPLFDERGIFFNVFTFSHKLKPRLSEVIPWFANRVGKVLDSWQDYVFHFAVLNVYQEVACDERELWKLLSDIDHRLASV